MKKILIAVAALVVMTVAGAGSAVAANNIHWGALGINVTVLDPVQEDGFVIAGKYFVAKDIAVLGGFGLGIRGEDANGTDFGIMVGGRKYLSTNDFAPFAGGRLSYRSTRDGDLKATSFMAEFGAECFLQKQFSIEGSVGIGYTSETNNLNRPSTTETTFGTQRLGISFNYYFF